MKFYNSLTRQKEEFVPLNKGKVKMYACGITPSAEAHIGHLYQALIYDIMRKFLVKEGFDVTYARNYTDVDDKIIAKSNELKVPAKDYAEKMIKEIDKEMQAFKIGEPDIWLYATKTIPDMINFIEKLIEKGHAYSTPNGDVYFSVDTFKRYGELSGRKTEDALDIVNSCADKGYQTALCMMAASTLGERAIDCALDKFARSQANIIYLMDSFGALMPEQVETLSDKYCQAAHSAGKLFGIHCHNNLQCAFANTIAAISRGADIADCTLAGLGKGAGNCPTEMLVKYVGQKYKLRPILKAVENFIEPMRKHFRWGFDYPYMISGLLNIHPREAMEFEKSLSLGERESIVDFYDKNFKKES